MAACAVAFAYAGGAPAYAAGSRGHSAAAHHGCQNTGAMPTEANLGLIRAATLCLINRERRAHGERPLRPNVRLRRAAQAHTESMAFGD